MDVIAREAWGAPADRSHLPALADSNGFGLHYNGPAMRLGAHSGCDDAVASIRQFHIIDKGWLDIAYSFLACPHGTVFEGRGWDKRTAANGTNDGNSWGLAIMCMIGGTEAPTEAMLAAVAGLCADHARRYSRVDLRPHFLFKATDCPGGPLTEFAVSGAWRLEEDDVVTEADKRDIAKLVVDELLTREVGIFYGPDKGERFTLLQLWRRMYQQGSRVAQQLLGQAEVAAQGAAEADAVEPGETL